MRPRFTTPVVNDFKFIGNKKITKVLKEFNNKYITVLEGSIRTGKSLLAALCLCLYIESSTIDEKLFLVTGYSAATAKNNIGTYVANYFTTAKCNTRAKYNGLDSYEIQTRTGIKNIIFSGGATVSSCNFFHGYTLSMIVMDEIDRQTRETLHEALQRGASFKNPHIICTLNPNLATHWVYKEIENWSKQDILFYQHFTLQDNPILTDEMIENVKKRFEPGTASYKRYILGERVNAEDALFVVNTYNILSSFDPKEYQDYIIVADPGMSISATVFICIAFKYLPDKGYYQLDIVKEYYHLNDKEHGTNIKMFKDYANDLSEFVLECKRMFKKYPYSVIVDDNVEFKRNLIESFNKHELGDIEIHYPKKYDDEMRISQIGELLYSGRFNIYDKCVHCIQDLNSATMDRKAADTGKIKINNNYTEFGHNDALDAIAYGIAALYNYCCY